MAFFGQIPSYNSKSLHQGASMRYKSKINALLMSNTTLATNEIMMCHLHERKFSIKVQSDNVTSVMAPSAEK